MRLPIDLQSLQWFNDNGVFGMWFIHSFISFFFIFIIQFREDMEKVNIKFHDNYTVTYQHKKILQFVPELSVDKNVRVITPNIPLLVCNRSQC